MRKLGIALLIVVTLVACASANDGGRTPLSTATMIALATATITPTPLPTATATAATTATPIPTFTSTRQPSPTLTEAQSRANTLKPLPGFTWQADGDVVKLYDAKNNAVATLDAKTGAVRWDAEDFPAINAFLTTLDGQKQLADFIKANPDIHFITYPDSRQGYPPYAVIPTADGQGIALVQDKTNTHEVNP